MIIVSQDGEIVINFKNVIAVELMGNKTVIRCETEKINYWLGNYKTKERAKQVLQEIIEKYASYLKLGGGPGLFKGDMDVPPNVFNIPKVYKMPLE